MFIYRYFSGIKIAQTKEIKFINLFVARKGDHKMRDIRIRELIITCESCGNVKKFRVNSQHDCEQIFHNFKCENNCGRQLYSFISVGTVSRPIIPSLQLDYAAVAK